jgi:hypothetical protein
VPWLTADGGGLDLPRRRVEAEGADASLRALLVDALGDTWPVELLGYVRNVVAGGGAEYPWPVPHAHFAVWRGELPPGVEVAGEWLGPDRAERELGERHWWPLAAHVLA